MKFSKRSLIIGVIFFSAISSVFSMSETDQKASLIFREKALKLIEIIKKNEQKTLLEKLYLYSQAPAAFAFIMKHENEDILTNAKGMSCSPNFATRWDHEDFWGSDFGKTISAHIFFPFEIVRLYCVAPYEKDVCSVEDHANEKGYLFFIKTKDSDSLDKHFYCGVYVPNTKFFELIELGMGIQPLIFNGLYKGLSRCSRCCKTSADAIL